MTAATLLRLALVVSLGALTGCTSPVTLTPTPPVIDPGGPGVVPPARDDCCGDPALPPPGPALATVPDRSVYFEFDQYHVSATFQPVIEAHAHYLASHRGIKVRLEGNADERGGDEFNLALGQKRAEAVRAALLAYGIGDDQLEAVSFGSERPRVDGHDEQSWAENRRVDFTYQQAAGG